MYNPTQDFLALLRVTTGGVRVERMPGLDYVVIALARMGLFEVWVNPTVAPPSQQATTVWVKPSSSSWAVESAVLLFNQVSGNFELATPALWQALLQQSAQSVFQRVASGAATIEAATTLVAVQRAGPALTTLALPTVVGRSQPLRIADWSTAVVNHEIDLNPEVGETIMQAAQWKLFSNAAQLSGITLYPSTDLNGWVVAP